MSSKRKILLVASGGGHWVQLIRLRQAWSHCDPAYVTVQPAYVQDVSGSRFYCVADATRWDRWKLLLMMLQVAWVCVRERPDVVITTGAAPGVVALRIGKWLGARTVWIDSIANVEEVSLSGQKVRGFADLWLTQWEALALEGGPSYKGAVL